MQRIFDPGLFLFHLDLGRGTDSNHRHTTGQFRDAFLHLLLVVVGRGFLDLDTDLVDAPFNVTLAAGAVDDGGVFLGDLHPFGAAKIIDAASFQAHPDFLRNDLTASQNRDILQHGFAPITKTWCLDRANLDDATDVVDHQGCQGFAIDVLRNHQQRTAGLGGGFQYRQQIANIRKLFIVDQNQRGVQISLHGVLVVDKVGRQVAAVKLHALDHLQLVLEGLALFDRDHAFFADFFH